MGVTNIFALPGYHDFYTRCRGCRALRMSAGCSTRVEQVAAANLGLIFRGSYYHLLAIQRRRAVEIRPRRGALHDLLRYAMERSCQAFDFTIGDERYKQE